MPATEERNRYRPETIQSTSNNVIIRFDQKKIESIRSFSYPHPQYNLPVKKSPPT